MKVTKAGIYKDKNGCELPVVNVGDSEKPYFRVYWQGGYYNVNKEPDNAPFDEIEWEMVECVVEF